MIEMLFAAVMLVGEPDCVYFQDGTMTHEEVMVACREYMETWVPPEIVEHQPVPLSWILYDLGIIGNVESGRTYVVQDGDLSLWSISQKLGIFFGDLLSLNPDNPDLIRVGDTIILPQ